MQATAPAQSVGEEIRQELLSAGPTLGLKAGNRALGIGTAHGYRLAKEGRYPVPLLRVGSSYRIVTAELLKLLRLDQTAS